MKQKKKQSASHAESVARRAFIKKAALSAVFAVPALESLTKSDLLVKSALAATVKTWTVTATVSTRPTDEGLGTVSPASQTVVDGGSATVTIQPATTPPSFWGAYSLDGGTSWIPPSYPEWLTGSITFTNVHNDIHIIVAFGLSGS